VRSCYLATRTPTGHYVRVKRVCSGAAVLAICGSVRCPSVTLRARPRLLIASKDDFGRGVGGVRGRSRLSSAPTVLGRGRRATRPTDERIPTGSAVQRPAERANSCNAKLNEHQLARASLARPRRRAGPRICARAGIVRYPRARLFSCARGLTCRCHAEQLSTPRSRRRTAVVGKIQRRRVVVNDAEDAEVVVQTLRGVLSFMQSFRRAARIRRGFPGRSRIRRRACRRVRRRFRCRLR
jgi:hypothetical protein